MSTNIKSAHSGGANAGFCDSHVTFLRDDAGSVTATGSTSTPAVTVYQELVTPDGTTLNCGEPSDRRGAKLADSDKR